jgi:hypothetical protein
MEESRQVSSVMMAQNHGVQPFLITMQVCFAFASCTTQADSAPNSSIFLESSIVALLVSLKESLQIH